MQNCYFSVNYPLSLVKLEKQNFLLIILCGISLYYVYYVHEKYDFSSMESEEKAVVHVGLPEKCLVAAQMLRTFSAFINK